MYTREINDDPIIGRLPESQLSWFWFRIVLCNLEAQSKCRHVPRARRRRAGVVYSYVLTRKG